jgi:hypothetical protein
MTNDEGSTNNETQKARARSWFSLLEKFWLPSSFVIRILSFGSVAAEAEEAG